MAKAIVEVIKVMVVGDVSSIEMEIENLWKKGKNQRSPCDAREVFEFPLLGREHTAIRVLENKVREVSRISLEQWKIHVPHSWKE